MNSSPLLLLNTILVLCLLLQPSYSQDLSVEVKNRPGFKIPWFYAHYEVIIKNGISDPHPLSIKCASHDDNLGFHVLPLNSDFHFKFKAWRLTEFWCDFWWNGLHVQQYVYIMYLAEHYCGVVFPRLNTCFWLAQKDGIYVSNHDNPQPAELHKVCSWDPKANSDASACMSQRINATM